MKTGKVYVYGDWVKPAKEVRMGQVVYIHNCDFEIKVYVHALSKYT